MQSKFILATMAASLIAFSWQPVMAQDDEGGQQQFQQQVEESEADQNQRNACSDAVLDNVDNPDALTRMNIGISPSGASLMSAMYQKMQEDYVRLLQMQQYAEAFNGVKLMLPGKANKKARDMITDLQANIQKQMDAVRSNLITTATIVIDSVATRCKNNRAERRNNGLPAISFGVGGSTDYGEDDHHHHHHSGCVPHP